MKLQYSRQKGFTLVELLFVLAILGLMMILEMQQRTIEIEQMRARQLGIEVFRYSTAVQEWVSVNSGRVDDVIANGEDGVKNGIDWLRGPSCGGVADSDYLPCEFLQGTGGRTTYGSLGITTTIVADDVNNILRAETVFDELIINGRSAGDLAGLAAMVASGAWNIGQSDPTLLTSDANIRYCVTAAGAPECAANERRIVVVSTNNSENDKWLRVDHGNKMQNIIEYDAGVTGTDPDYGFSLRQLKNIARIYNEGEDSDGDGVADGIDYNGDGIPDDSLFLGKDGHVLPATLLSAGVVVDANQAILGRLNVIGDIETQGGDIVARAGEDIDGNFVGGNVEALSGVSPSGTVVGGDINADDDLTIGNNADIGNGQGGDLRVRAYDDSNNSYGQGGSALIDRRLLVGHNSSGGTIHSRVAGSTFDNSTLQDGDIRADNDLSIGRNATVFGWIKSTRADEMIIANGLSDLDDDSYFIDPDKMSNLKDIGLETISGTRDGGDLDISGNEVNLNADNLNLNAETSGNPSIVSGEVNLSSLRVLMESGASVPFTQLIPKYVHKGTVVVSNEETVPFPSDCSDGVNGTPKIVLVPQGIRMNVLLPSQAAYLSRGGWAGWYTYATEISGRQWRITIDSTYRDGEGAGDDSVLLAHTYCEY